MDKKLHRILAEAAVAVVREIFEEGKIADRAVGLALGAHPKWGKRDRALVAETVYEVVRWRRRLAVLAGSDEVWSLCGFWWESQGFDRPDWAVWPAVEENTRAGREASLAGMPRAVRFSLTDELDALGAADLGEQWEVELAALNQPAPLFLRVNPRRGHVASVRVELEAVGISTLPVAGCPFGLEVSGGRALPASLKASGRFEIQDAASQQVAPFCQVEPGMRVVDACAGAGGKTLHLAALMAGKGDLLALDVVPAKLESLKARAARATVKVRTALVSEETLEVMAGQADRVLVDAPCSGTGTLRRQADLKYRITAESVAAAVAAQRGVLERAASMVRPGGKLIYATCSILKQENEAQAAWFSASHPEFVFEEDRRISPAAMGWDGFYMARWQRGQNNC